jgi:hypothetical protein
MFLKIEENVIVTVPDEVETPPPCRQGANRESPMTGMGNFEDERILKMSAHPVSCVPVDRRRRYRDCVTIYMDTASLQTTSKT